MTASKRSTPRRLPRGRHPFTQEAVAASQRARLLDALPRVVADKGYGATTVADVIALAGVSRRTFYEQFPKIEDCFLAAYAEGMQSLLATIREALRGVPADDWRLRARVAVEAYLQALASRPEAAWAYSVEALGAGRLALGQRAWVMAQWIAQWRALWVLRQAGEPELGDIEDAQLLALVGGIEELVRECLRSRGAKWLPGLAAAAGDFALAVLEASGKPPRPAAPTRPVRRIRNP